MASTLSWLHHYDRRWLRKDLVGGVTAGAVVIPQAMAYATIANLPVQVDKTLALARQLPRWAEVESSGRYFTTVLSAARAYVAAHSIGGP